MHTIYLLYIIDIYIIWYVLCTIYYIMIYVYIYIYICYHSNSGCIYKSRKCINITSRWTKLLVGLYSWNGVSPFSS